MCFHVNFFKHRILGCIFKEIPIKIVLWDVCLSKLL